MRTLLISRICLTPGYQKIFSYKVNNITFHYVLTLSHAHNSSNMAAWSLAIRTSYNDSQATVGRFEIRNMQCRLGVCNISLVIISLCLLWECMKNTSRIKKRHQKARFKKKNVYKNVLLLGQQVYSIVSFNRIIKKNVCGLHWIIGSNLHWFTFGQPTLEKGKDNKYN